MYYELEEIISAISKAKRIINDKTSIVKEFT